MKLLLILSYYIYLNSFQFSNLMYYNSLLAQCVAYCLQVIAKFLGLMYSFLNISLSKNIVPDEIKGREIHHSFPMTLFQVVDTQTILQCSD